ncbi:MULTISPECIES: DUF6230 family protein [unclassified Gordonia (in: high G+C Gram-positive bacteria)]|uniref:DUF6230 family protein n=1 Tax=unclassified Gordonia (in: high G+C Gram-positive bacteria) TaxID=2657482 RepID=UPI0007EA3EA1|nr:MULTISPECIES: DUF6230 family protein [unclassified Gordonia (in: high G+C Gram-positive bacteria)]OBB99651.1 hypothetical protein A5785_19965 [Gordonia sp. 852002-50395_SCH5434458]OBC13876.1 hypothetical protein A5788_18415 [Gordonia sp. 852002-50816_SCH5313054-c]OBC16184.1 hypothetical protein A5786_20600 [Gordonia sp. 852002-50816_SCH5313054-a]
MRIRKRVAATVLVAGFGAAALLGTGIARGDLPMNIALSGQSFTATIGSKPVMAVRLGTATLTDLCLAMAAHNIPLVGDATLIIRAPGPSTHAENLVLDADSLGGQIGIKNLIIGADVSTTDPRAAQLTSAIIAESSALVAAHVTATAIRASSLRLDNFSATIDKGERTC